MLKKFEVFVDQCQEVFFDFSKIDNPHKIYLSFQEFNSAQVVAKGIEQIDIFWVCVIKLIKDRFFKTGVKYHYY